MAVPKRSDIRPGLPVQIVEKQNQRTGLLSAGIVARVLTKSSTHPHGIKVMLEDGRVGWVQVILGDRNEA